MESSECLSPIRGFGDCKNFSDIELKQLLQSFNMVFAVFASLMHAACIASKKKIISMKIAIIINSQKYVLLNNCITHR